MISTRWKSRRERERERGLALQTFSILVERRGMTAKAVSKQEALPLPILVLLVFVIYS